MQVKNCYKLCRRNTYYKCFYYLRTVKQIYPLQLSPMENFNLNEHLDHFYSHFPAAGKRPIIGITGNHADIDLTLRERYYNQIAAAGGTPIVIPPLDNTEIIDNTLNQIDALLLTGGADFDPRWTGEEVVSDKVRVNVVRDLPELLTIRMAYNKQIPMLGICRGMQALAVAFGGNVMQDIQEHCQLYGIERQPSVNHDQKEERTVTTHIVKLTEESTLKAIYGKQEIPVNTFHHQAVESVGPSFRITATAPDGIIEGMESNECKPIMGVQWHPEWLEQQGLPIFQWLVQEARLFQQAKQIHQKIITLDTHCDTPMFFAQDINFASRDHRILVDLQKMDDGRLDAVTMVCYLPQPKPGETFQQRVDFPVSGPKNYADLIFDKIERIVADNPSHMALARTPDEIGKNKQQGKHSIILGIENGLALEGLVENVEYFANRGISYITLCHNGDNDICDSAKGSQTHGGVSALGAKVIEEMNRCGVMVDLSHAAESSFYDALQISRYPIVCSHSNCRALCDHPRNLTDDQLRALARKGGVAHTTFYAGFLRSAGEPDIYDAVAHLEHAIDLMGIDGVGIGTDFDGDGGVRGMANAAEVINFTIQLLRRRYSEEAIRKIWGENWLRVMRQVKQL